MENLKENNLPFVSLIIPCRNEEKFIGKCLDSLINQDYPKDKLEILVVDGMSKDKTREMVEKVKSQNSKVKIFLLDNLNKTSPYALNIGIKNAKGDVVSHLGAHAEYNKDFVSKSIKYLFEYGADCVGGIAKAMPKNDSLSARAIALCLSNKFGGGGSFRTGVDKPVFADTAFGCFYKKEVFEKIGLFNEKMTRSQDMEFNMRLRKAGGKILLASDIVIYYYPKSNFKDFFKHNVIDGFWTIYPLKFKVKIFSLRHLVPLFFFSVILLGIILGIFFKIFLWLLLAMLILYFVITIVVSFKIAKKEKSLILIPFLMVAFFIRHFAYGLGSFGGLIRIIV